MKEKARINWKYFGKNDFVNGTGAYFEEKLLGYVGSLIIPIFIIISILSDKIQWNIPQIIIALLIGFDMGGGMISNSLNSGKRFYHTEINQSDSKFAKLLKNKLLFAAIHIQPIVIGLVFNHMDWKYGLFWYAIFILAVYVVYRTPLYLKRPISMLMILIAILINSLVLVPIVGFGWFIPVLFLKIVYGHMVREEPYRKII